MASKKPERRRSSGRYNIVNPLEGTSAAALESLTNVSAAPNKDGSRVHTSNQGPLAVTAADRPISQDDFIALQRTLESLSDNEEILRHLSASLHRRLFTSAQIKSLIETTPSVKTRLQMVDSLGPRCTNPGEATAIVDSFRFTAEKAHVSELLHARERVLKANALTPSVRTREGASGRGAARGGGVSGRGGRGGKGAGSRTSTLAVERIDEAKESAADEESSDENAGNAESRRGSIADSVREIRKTAASLTGLHGLLSGKKGPERASFVAAPESVASPLPGAALLQPPDKAPPPPPTVSSQQPEVVSTPSNELTPTVEAPSVPALNPYTSSSAFETTQTASVPDPSSSASAPATTQTPSVPDPSSPALAPERNTQTPSTPAPAAVAAPPLVDSPPRPHALPPRPTLPSPPHRPRPSCSLALPPPPSAPSPALIAATPTAATPTVVASVVDASPARGATDNEESASEESVPAKALRSRAATLLFSAVKEADEEDEEDEDQLKDSPTDEDQTIASQPPATTRTEGPARSARVSVSSSIGSSVFGALTRGRSGSEAAWNSHRSEPADHLRSTSTLTPAATAFTGEPSHRGWVHLRSGMFMASWDVLYFVLSREKEGGLYFLFYYKEAWGGKTGQAPSGKIAIHGCRVEHSAATDAWFPFTVTTSAGKAHLLRVTTEDERQLWCQMISQALSSM